MWGLHVVYVYIHTSCCKKRKIFARHLSVHSCLEMFACRLSWNFVKDQRTWRISPASWRIVRELHRCVYICTSQRIVYTVQNHMCPQEFHELHEGLWLVHDQSHDASFMNHLWKLTRLSWKRYIYSILCQVLGSVKQGMYMCQIARSAICLVAHAFGSSTCLFLALYFAC